MCSPHPPPCSLLVEGAAVALMSFTSFLRFSPVSHENLPVLPHAQFQSPFRTFWLTLPSLKLPGPLVPHYLLLTNNVYVPYHHLTTSIPPTGLSRVLKSLEYITHSAEHCVSLSPYTTSPTVSSRDLNQQIHHPGRKQEKEPLHSGRWPFEQDVW